MSKSDFVDYVVHDLLSGLKDIRSRAMFGGHGIYKEDVIFAILVDNRLYFKVDETNKKDYEKKGSKPFTYRSSGRDPVSMSYWEVPAEILEDREEINRWAEKSYRINLKLKQNNKKNSGKSKRTRRLTGLAIVYFGIVCPSLLLASPIARSGPSKVSLLEVYSSDGCSSCPPAEEWVSRQTQNSGLWKDLVPVVFHVDYWNYLGWKDEFSEGKFSERQKNYAASWGNDNVYTPGFILDGKEWRDWSGSDTVKPPMKEPGVLVIENSGDDLFKITFKPMTKDRQGNSYTAHAALLGFGIASDVKAGENAGRKIEHDFTVLDYVEKDMSASKDGIFEGGFSLKVPKRFSSKKLAVSAWVSEGNSPAPIQAAGGYLAVKK